MTSHQRHRRRARTSDTANQHTYRLTALWPSTTRPTCFQTTDRRRINRVAGQLAGAGAVVEIEEHHGHGAWTFLRRLDEPTKRRARTHGADTAARPDAGREGRLDDVERLMAGPPIPRDGGKPSARTIANGRGIR